MKKHFNFIFNKPFIPDTLLYSVKIIFIVFICWVAYTSPTSYSHTERQSNNSIIYPTTDLISWNINLDEQIEAVSVYRPCLRNIPIDSSVFGKNILKRIDYKPVYVLKTVEDIVASCPVGTVLIYEIQHLNQTKAQLFKVITYQMMGLSTENHVINILLLGFLGVISIVGVGFLVILMPFLSVDLKKNIPLLGLVVLTLGFCLLQIFRIYNFESHWNEPLRSLETEKILLTISIISLSVIAIFRRNYSKTTKRRFLTCNLLIWLSFIVVFVFLQYGGSWHSVMNGTLNSYSIYFVAFIGTFLIGSAYQGIILNQKSQSKFISRFGLALFVFNIFLLGALVNLLWEFDYHKHTNFQIPYFFWGSFFLSTFLSVLISIRKIFIYTSLSFRLIQILMITVGLLWCLTYLDGSIKPEIVGILGILTFILVVINILKWLLGKLGYDFSTILTPQKRLKNQRFKDYLRQLPLITSADEVIRKSEEVIADYLQATKIKIYSEEKGLLKSEDENLFSTEIINQIHDQLSAQDIFWSKSKELSHFVFLPEIENKLIQQNITLIFCIKRVSAPKRLLIINAKENGVFTFQDIEFLLSTIDSIHLSFEILALLDKEKILIEKTMEANLIALRAQINPHFLFNTFNSISDLIHVNPEGAEQALEKLAYILRYTLTSSKNNFAYIEDEIKLIRYYLDIEQIRFGDRLQVEIDIEPQTYNTLAPAFVIQTIVENSIKHGIAKIKSGGVVIIKTEIMEKSEEVFTKISIYDNGPGIDLKLIHRSTGISNTLARLQNLYDRDDLIKFENTGNGTLVTILIPIED